MLQRMGVLDQPLAGLSGVCPQVPYFCNGSSCQALRFALQASETQLKICVSFQSPSPGFWYSSGVLCWAQGRPFWVSLGERCFCFTAAHGRPMDALETSRVERKAKGCSCDFC
jgi:hypothetical protein